VAVLTFHDQKRTESANEDWVPVLHKMEFLVGISFPRLGEGKFNNTFRTLTLSSSQSQQVGLSERHDWHDRLGFKYIKSIRTIAHNIKDARFQADMAQLNAAMSAQLGSILRAEAAAERALSSQLRPPSPVIVRPR
jgi:hypothetical protein